MKQFNSTILSFVILIGLFGLSYAFVLNSNNPSKPQVRSFYPYVNLRRAINRKCITSNSQIRQPHNHRTLRFAHDSDSFWDITMEDGNIRLKRTKSPDELILQDEPV